MCGVRYRTILVIEMKFLSDIMIIIHHKDIDITVCSNIEIYSTDYNDTAGLDLFDNQVKDDKKWHNNKTLHMNTRLPESW